VLDVKHYVGLDLGQVSDYTALVTLRREQELPDPPKPKTFSAEALDWKEIISPPVVKPQLARYYCNIAERFELGMSYTVMANNLCRLFDDVRFAKQTLVVDGTGVGRPVVDMFRKARPNCRILPVTITGGSQALGQTSVDEYGYWHVPKKELVGSVQALLGTGRLEVAPDLRHAAVLVSEMKSFRYKINNETAHVSYEAWRDREHDDLVLALALAAWAGERGRKELWVL